MDRSETLRLLENVKNGVVSPAEALKAFSEAPFTDIGYAKIDHHRALRQGVSEVIFGQGKTPEQIRGIVAVMKQNGARDILVTRISPACADTLDDIDGFEYLPTPRLAIVDRTPDKPLRGDVAVVCAGTSDLPMAEEAAVTAEVLGSRVTRIYDAGVAGIHRLLAHLDELTGARAIVAVAGMEGALPSVVGGLVSCPVIAVPTSVGYGASFGGVSALLAMLNSCASGVSVVNIDNGFGAGYLAHIINMMEGIK
ncbi:MAG: nickel pincer cofactor biosynthesis protein LarB [Oscillospiraceae bacterium]|nr:nickel pincer cofactor biosynthesis protein LarB [Oscillospiraceae bacterium]